MIYCIITSILFIDNILPFLACAILDLLLLIALIIVAVMIGKPLSYLKCSSLRLPSTADSDSSALAFTTHLKSYLNQVGGKVSYIAWIGASKAVCLEGKAIWGLCIALWYVPLLAPWLGTKPLQYSVLLFRDLCSLSVEEEEEPAWGEVGGLIDRDLGHVEGTRG